MEITLVRANIQDAEILWKMQNVALAIPVFLRRISRILQPEKNQGKTKWNEPGTIPSSSI